MTKEDLQYVENKHRGGENNAKGNSFEAFYAVYYILKHFNLGDEDKTYFFPQMKLTFLFEKVRFSCRMQRKNYSLELESAKWKCRC